MSRRVFLTKKISKKPENYHQSYFKVPFTLEKKPYTALEYFFRTSTFQGIEPSNVHRSQSDNYECKNVPVQFPILQYLLNRTEFSARNQMIS